MKWRIISFLSITFMFLAHVSVLFVVLILWRFKKFEEIQKSKMAAFDKNQPRSQGSFSFSLEIEPWLLLVAKHPKSGCLTKFSSRDG